MFNGRILVATDGSTLSEKAVTVAVDLAKAVGAELVAFTAVPLYPYAGIGESSAIAGGEYDGRAGAEASARLAVVERRATQAGVACHTSMLEDDAPHRAIVAAADKHACGLIVMASHGRRGLNAVLLGSETQKVLTHSTIPVMVYR